MKWLRRYLVAGILVWVPLAVTYALLRFVVGLMDRTLLLLPAPYRPEILLQQLFGTDNPIQIPGLGVILTGGWESILDRIPVVRSVYGAAKNFAEIVFSDSSQSFKNVLLIQYPREGLYSLAFQRRDRPGYGGR